MAVRRGECPGGACRRWSRETLRHAAGAPRRRRERTADAPDGGVPRREVQASAAEPAEATAEARASAGADAASETAAAAEADSTVETGSAAEACADAAPCSAEADVLCPGPRGGADPNGGRRKARGVRHQSLESPGDDDLAEPVSVTADVVRGAAGRCVRVSDLHDGSMREQRVQFGHVGALRASVARERVRPLERWAVQRAGGAAGVLPSRRAALRGARGGDVSASDGSGDDAEVPATRAVRRVLRVRASEGCERLHDLRLQPEPAPHARWATALKLDGTARFDRGWWAAFQRAADRNQVVAW